MAPLIYPQPTWSNRFGSFVRTLQVVAIAGAIGAVGGGMAVMGLIGTGGSSRPPTALNVRTADHAKAGPAETAPAHPADAAPAAPQPDAAAAAAQVAPAAPATADASARQSPDAAAPSSNAAATEQHPVLGAAEPESSSAGKPVYNRAEPEDNGAGVRTSRVRPKATRRTKTTERARRERGAPNTADAYSTDYDARYYSAQRSGPYSAARGRYPDDRNAPYPGQRYSYGAYDPPHVARVPAPAVRGYYYGGGGGFYDRGGGWGN